VGGDETPPGVAWSYRPLGPVRSGPARPAARSRLRRGN